LPSGFLIRSISSILVVIVAAAVVYSPRPILILLLIALAFIGALELYRMVSSLYPGMSLGLLLLLTISIVISGALANMTGKLSWVLFACCASVLSPAAFSVLRLSPKEGMIPWLFTTGSSLYVGLPMAHIELIRGLESGREWLILAIISTWVTDTSAYIAGSMFGRRKLVPKISPGKTVEGAVASTVFTILLVTILVPLFRLPISLTWGPIVGLALAFACQMGDLAESFIKRAVGVKDSGNIIPGHGGLLDRIDGLLWVVLITYYIANLALT